MNSTNILIAGIGIIAILVIAFLARHQNPTQHIGPVINHPVVDDGQPHICGGHQENHCHHYGPEPARRETRNERPTRERVRETRERIDVRRDADENRNFVPAEVRRDDREAVVVEERLPLCDNGDGRRVSKPWHRVCDECHFGTRTGRGTTETRPPATPVATVRLTPTRPVAATATAPTATRAAVFTPARPAAPVQATKLALVPTPVAQTVTGAQGLPELTID